MTNLRFPAVADSANTFQRGNGNNADEQDRPCSLRIRWESNPTKESPEGKLKKTGRVQLAVI